MKDAADLLVRHCVANPPRQTATLLQNGLRIGLGLTVLQCLLFSPHAPALLLPVREVQEAFGSVHILEGAQLVAAGPVVAEGSHGVDVDPDGANLPLPLGHVQAGEIFYTGFIFDY